MMIQVHRQLYRYVKKPHSTIHSHGGRHVYNSQPPRLETDVVFNTSSRQHPHFSPNRKYFAPVSCHSSL